MTRYERNLLLISISLVFVFLVSKVLSEGMFFDGLTYASISRNLAYLGSDSVSLSYLGKPFYGHPPLFFYIQSVFYTVLGDSFWVEKLFVFLEAMLNLWLLTRLINVLFDRPMEGQYGWTLITILLTPIYMWAMPQNILENMVVTFGVAASIFTIRYLRFKNNWDAVAGIILTVLCVWVKGPVGLYVLALPFLYSGIVQSAWKKGIINSLFFTLWVVFLSGLLLLIPDVKAYMQNYMQMQILYSITAQDTGFNGVAVGRFYIMFKLVAQGTPVLWVLFLIIDKVRNKQVHTVSLFAGCMGLASSIPLMISMKQMSFYLIPSMSWFAISIGWYLSNWMGFYKRFMELKPVMGMAVLLALVSAGYSLMQIGKIDRDVAYVQDVRALDRLVDKHKQVHLNHALSDNWVAQAYLHRYLNWTFSFDHTSIHNRYYLIPTHTLSDTALKPLFTGAMLTVYEKSPLSLQ